MSKTAIMTDTNSGMSVEEGQRRGIFVLPMPVIVDGQDCVEGVDITYDRLFAAMKRGAPVSSSQPAPGALMDTWDAILRDHDEIVYIPMSSGLSGSCQTAMQLAEDYGGRVHVVDNRRISLTQSLSVYDARSLADAGLSAAAIADRLRANAMNASIYITVNTLEYLKRSGRVTPAAAAIGTVLNIKPVLTIQGGKLDSFAKVRSMKQARERMIAQMRKELTTRFAAFPRARVLVGTAGSFSDPADAKAWLAQVRDAFPGHPTAYAPLSCSISSHTGEGACGMGIIVLEHDPAMYGTAG